MIEFIDAAISMVGTPYRHQGRTPGKELDCAGVIECAARMAGLEVIEYNRGYGRLPNQGHLVSALLSQPWARQAGQKWAPGNILLIRWKKDPQHLAILTDRGTMIHAYGPSGCVIEIPLTQDWKEKTVMQIEVIE